MKAFNILGFCLTMAALCSTKAGQNKPDVKDNPTNVLICLQLTNASLITGKAVMSTVSLETSFTSVKVALELIDTIRFEENDLTVVKFLSGERLKGKVKDAFIETETLVGRLHLPTRIVRKINVIHPDIMPAELKEGLLFYYSFNKNESGKITDDSGNGCAGIAESAAWIPDGFLRGARRFRGDPDQIRAPNSPALNPRMFTLSTWITTTNLPTSTEAGIFGKGKRYNNRNSFQLSLTPSAKLTFIIIGEQQRSATITAGAEPIRNKWGLVTIIYDGARVRMFINDKLAGEAETVNVKYVGNEYDLLVGASGADENRGNSRESWRGAMDEVRFYNRAFSEKEVQQLFFSDMLRYKAVLYEALCKTEGADNDAAPATVYLNDRSKLKGELALKRFALRLDDIGDIIFPLPLLKSVCRSAEDPRVVVTLKNGDIFIGATDLKEFDFSAVFGKVSVQLAKMSALTFGESELMISPLESALRAVPPLIPPPIKPVEAKEISALIADLQAKDSSDREKAVRRLVQIGRPALPALKKLLNETDADARWWVEAVIQEIENKRGN